MSSQTKLAQAAAIASGKKPLPRGIRHSLIEVERKFQYDPTSVKRFRMNDGEPAFRQLTYRGTELLRDVYYDFKNELLTKSGLWVRQRNGEWEAKKKQWGDFNNSQFEEVTGRHRVLDLLLRLEHERLVKMEAEKAQQDDDSFAQQGSLSELPRIDPAHPIFGLSLFADLQTSRESWVVNDTFNVVFDTTNFGHGVGEVEMQETVAIPLDTTYDGQVVESDYSHEYLTQAKRQAGAAMDQKIEAFMKEHAWAFPQGKPIGKLTAYCAWKEKQRLC
ncbi:hypothetical protein KEM54_004958 [Ascosphaera aggregata]|nr:hypothetical protein KEM54_004958 [Ascosphaera aggregata]